MSGRGEGKSKATIKLAGPIWRSERARLQFPVPRLARRLKKGQCAKRVGPSAPVYFAAVMEYLAAEVLDVAVEACSTHKKKIITPRHIQLGIRGDDELGKLFSCVTIAKGAVIPDINPLLLPTKTCAKPEKEATSCKVEKTKWKSRKSSSVQQKFKFLIKLKAGVKQWHFDK